MNFPSDLKYTEDHEWVRLEAGNIAYVGITDFAQSELGELVYIEVDNVGTEIEAGAVFGTIEAVKTTSDLFMPVNAKVLAFNPALDDTQSGAALINEDPYGKGWIIRVELKDPKDLEGLMSVADYEKHTGH